MKFRLLIALMFCSVAVPAFAETLGEVAADPSGSSPDQVAEPRESELNEDAAPTRNCEVEPCILNHRSKRMIKKVVQQQLGSKMFNYDLMRICIWGTPGHVLSSCVERAGFCKISSTLENHQKFPIGSVIVYHRHKDGAPSTNIGSIKTGEHRYYTGPDISAPLPSSSYRRLLGVWAPKSSSACRGRQ